MLSLEDIIELNKRNGGQELNTSSISFALTQGEGRNPFKQLALLWRAILIDHGFTDANKRTALDVATINLTKSGYQMTENRMEELTKHALKITKKKPNRPKKNRIQAKIRNKPGKIKC